MITVENAMEMIEFLEEQLSNSYFHENAESNKNGYQCAINDIKEHYVDSVIEGLN